MNAQGSRVEEAAAPYRVAPPLTDHLDTFASAPEGFKRLRELVLNLAVRGRLTSRIVGDELPAGWGIGQFGDCAEVVRGITFPASEKSKTPEPGRVACLRTANIQDEVEWDDLLFVRESFLSRQDQLVRQGDLVMSMANSKELVGKVAQVTDVRFPCAIGGFLAIIRGIKLSSNFLLILLRSSSVRTSLIDSSTQTTNIANISLSRLRPLPVPVPPLAEQSRIVAKVDELMALIDALEAKVGAGETARVKLRDAFFDALADSPDAAATAVAWAQLAPHFDLLLQTPADVDRLQQTLLQLAVKGRLVPQDPNDEPASELLKRIRAEKDRLAADRKIKRGQPSAAVAENAKSFCVPHGWKWVRAIDLCASITDGDHLPPPKADEGIPFLVIGNIRDGKVAIESATRFVPKYYFDNLDWSRMPQVGDVLYTTVGSFGIPAPVTEVRDFCFQRHIALFRPALKGFQDFLTLFLRSDLAFKQAETGATGIAQKTVPLSALRSIAVPLPPLLEQSRIVAAVASLTALCDRLRERLAARRDLAAKLATALTETAARTVESSAC